MCLCQPNIEAGLNHTVLIINVSTKDVYGGPYYTNI